MTRPLSLDDFGAFFEAVHGPTPFPWQERLLREVVGTGRWPSVLDLPTGAGKTSTIDIALFHLALEAEKPPVQRTAPLRIVVVVDRRTIVDQAIERARRIRARLLDAPDDEGVLARVRSRLCALSGTYTVFNLAQLRGGMPREDAWAKRPDVPVVAVSTVDQVGSRLLFRGYGVSPGMRPVHAGLLGNDTLFLLDEVHLSVPFKSTLRSVERYRAIRTGALPDRWQVVEMSATPSDASQERPFSIDADDRANATLNRRLRASKPAELEEVRVSGGEARARTAFAAACTARAERLAAPGRAIAVIVNRVATARLVASQLQAGSSEREVVLLTGRMRPIDRDGVGARLADRLRSGRTRESSARPLFVVSTQCIEAGADYDFDALVTECASLDALRQRFGRLNRAGDVAEAPAVILVRSDSLKATDPIYGDALRETWTWLGAVKPDFGIEALGARMPDAETLRKLLPPRARAPIMLPSHLNAWVQTSPVPRPDPDVALWLHGIDRRQDVDVRIVWRIEVSEELLERSGDGKPGAMIDRLTACPPSTLEALSVPVWAVRAWLANESEVDVADVELRADDEEEREAAERTSKKALRWAEDASTIVTASEVGPGDVLIVPIERGGLRDGNWDPTSTTPVVDLGDEARWRQHGKPVLRAHPSLYQGSNPPPWSNLVAEDADARALLLEWLERLRLLSPERRPDEAAIELLAQPRRRKPAIVLLEGPASLQEAHDFVVDVPAFEHGYAVIVGRERRPKAAVDAGGDVVSDGDDASFVGVEVTLREHLRGVEDWARRFGERCGLPADLVEAVAIAARVHDLGKADERFQLMLHGGDRFAAEVAIEPLAKSRLVLADRDSRIRARERSGYPRGARHELTSVALLNSEPTLLSDVREELRDLVTYLVASHHGWCRPMAPVAIDPEPVHVVAELDGRRVTTSSAHALEKLDSGLVERFWRLVAEYGWFGLAWLESILRLADHRRSEEEQER